MPAPIPASGASACKTGAASCRNTESQTGRPCLLGMKAWSPYAAGILIGLLQVPAFLLIHTALGASSSYVTVGGLLASVVDPAVTQIDYVARHVAPTGKNWWQVALVVGVAMGAFLSMRLSGARRQTVSPIWARALGTPSRAVRYGVAFCAGFLMLFGARIADGCTSGHGLSGMAQMAVSSTIAVAFMFIGGIATAFLILRRI
ncbi:MAG: YeeE/YedE thiosulfate transporter family protein [Xanthobacter sp.]